MKFKRLFAGIMTFVFSLSMAHIKVSAGEIVEKVADEKEKITIVLEEDAKGKEDVTNEEATEESTAKKVLVKIANGAKTVAVGAGKLGLSGIKKVLDLAKTGVEYVAIGFCMMIGASIFIVINDEFKILDV